MIITSDDEGSAARGARVLAWVFLYGPLGLAVLAMIGFEIAKLVGFLP